MTISPRIAAVGRGSSWTPALVVLILATLLVAVNVVALGGDPLALARLGSTYSEGVSEGTEGYDGQFIYAIAIDPRPQAAAPHLDVPAYRYQRILMPLLVRALALGRADWIPWTMILVGVLALTAGTWAVAELFAGWGVSRWYALLYGLWAGFTLALVVDLPEPLAYGLVAGGILALERQPPGSGRLGRWQKPLGWLLLTLAVFARETTILFTAALLLVYLVRRSWRDLFGLALTAVLPFAVFQGWLWLVFGRPGIGSGGAMATPFELIPFMGILRIGQFSLVYLLAMLLVFGPTVILPAVWGTIVSLRAWLSGEKTLIAAALFLNAIIIAFTPFSTFRETGGIIRFATGMIVALFLFAARYGYRRVLNYSWFLFVLNVFLVK